MYHGRLAPGFSPYILLGGPVWFPALFAYEKNFVVTDCGCFGWLDAEGLRRRREREGHAQGDAAAREDNRVR
jgi:hypothetical protein